MIVITEMDAGGSWQEQWLPVRSSEAKLLGKYVVQVGPFSLHTLWRTEGPQETHTQPRSTAIDSPANWANRCVLLFILSAHSNTCPSVLYAQHCLDSHLLGPACKSSSLKKIVFLWNMSRKCALYFLSASRADPSYSECESSNWRVWARTLLLRLPACNCLGRIWGHGSSGQCHPWCLVDPMHGFPPKSCVFLPFGLGKSWVEEQHYQARWDRATKTCQGFRFHKNSLFWYSA